MALDALGFAAAARVVAGGARSLGLVAPSFRTPPKVAGPPRTLRRSGDGSVTVAVALRSRPWSAVLADLIEGVVAANGIEGVAAAGCRDELWRRLEAASIAGVARPASGAAPTLPPRETVTPRAA